jgi:hypothetical protein
MNDRIDEEWAEMFLKREQRISSDLSRRRTGRGDTETTDQSVREYEKVHGHQESLHNEDK